MSHNKGGSPRDRKTSPSSFPTKPLIRWIGIPIVVIGFALAAAGVVSDVVSRPQALLSTAERNGVSNLSTATLISEPSDKSARVALSGPDKAASIASAKAERFCASCKGTAVTTARLPKAPRHFKSAASLPMAAFLAKPAASSAFDDVARSVSLTETKIRQAFADAGMEIAEPSQVQLAGKSADPAPVRFGKPVLQPSTDVALGYADPSPSSLTRAVAALSAIAPEDSSDSAELQPDSDADLAPEFPTTPDSVAVPSIERPGDKPKSKRAERIEPELAPEPKPVPGTKLAFAKPDMPVEKPGSGGIFKNFFNKPKVGNGVAVYDISAAKVYMPDGSVLEAHSGIGKMADNPRYVHVKMNGPTPPHTYNLRMREKRFHGVEAIRMIPVDGKNKFGRDGFLTHSYLLRGGRAESHGCVAFKDYKRFLDAFKRGHVRQLVVVPGNGRKPDIRVASRGRDA